jgi:hypothetical protein
LARTARGFELSFGILPGLMAQGHHKQGAAFHAGFAFDGQNARLQPVQSAGPVAFLQINAGFQILGKGFGFRIRFVRLDRCGRRIKVAEIHDPIEKGKGIPVVEFDRAEAGFELIEGLLPLAKVDQYFGQSEPENDDVALILLDAVHQQVAGILVPFVFDVESCQGQQNMWLAAGRTLADEFDVFPGFLRLIEIEQELGTGQSRFGILRLIADQIIENLPGFGVRRRRLRFLADQLREQQVRLRFGGDGLAVQGSAEMFDRRRDIPRPVFPKFDEGQLFPEPRFIAEASLVVVHQEVQVHAAVGEIPERLKLFRIQTLSEEQQQVDQFPAFLDLGIIELQQSFIEIDEAVLFAGVSFGNAFFQVHIIAKRLGIARLKVDVALIEADGLLGIRFGQFRGLGQERTGLPAGLQFVPAEQRGRGRNHRTQQQTEPFFSNRPFHVA